MRLLSAVGLAALLASCFSPVEKDGVVRCGPAYAECPPGYACGDDQLCYRRTPDAPLLVADAAAGEAVDAPVAAPPDARAEPPDARAEPPDARPKPACSDGIDNDCDGKIDWPDDPGCSGPDDPDEHGSTACDDGIDNDGDGKTDFHVKGSSCGPGDDKCRSPADDTEEKK